MSNDQPTAAQALEAVRLSRETLADRMGKPSWFDLVYAGSAAAMVAAQALPFPLSVMGTGLCTVCLAVSYKAWMRETGVSITGLTPRRARWVAMGLGVVLLAIFLVTIHLKVFEGMWWAPLAGAPVAGAAAHLSSRLWMRVYRRELRDGA